MPRINQSLKQISARNKRNVRLMTLAMFLAVVMLTASFLFGEMGIIHFSKMEATLRQYQQEVHVLEQTNNTLFNELASLRTDSFYIEQLARERLGYIKKGELSYEFYDP